ALTHARHQAIVWWAGSWDSRHSALGRLLFAREPDGNVPPAGSFTPTDAAATARFHELAALSAGCISVERAVVEGASEWAGAGAAAGALSAARFDRDLDLGWRSTPASDITTHTDDAHVGSEPEEQVIDDEEPVSAPASVVAADGDEQSELRALPSLLAAMPAGVRVGTFVHRVFEAADFAAPDLAAELATRIDAVQARRRVEIGDPGDVVTGL